MITLASITGAFAEPSLAAYGASKTALISLMESLNAEESSNGVMAAAYVATDMSARPTDLIPAETMIQVRDIVAVTRMLLDLGRTASISKIVIGRSGTNAARLSWHRLKPVPAVSGLYRRMGETCHWTNTCATIECNLESKFLTSKGPVAVRDESSSRLVLTALSCAVASFVLLQSLFVPVLPLVQDQFHTDAPTASWVFTAYLLAASVATPLLGRLGDIVGRRRVMMATMSVVAVGCFLAALSSSIGWLIGARTLQGFGGGILPLAFGIVRDELPPVKLRPAIGALASLASAGFGIGIVAAGPAVQYLGYDWIFWLPCVVSTLAVAAIWRWVPAAERGRTSEGIPWLPAILLSIWLTSLLLLITCGSEWGLTSGRSLVAFLTLLIGFALWLARELHRTPTLVDLRMMRSPGMWTTSTVAIFVGFANFASFASLPQLLQTPTSTGYGFGATVAESGHLLLPMALCSFVVGLVSSRLVDRLGARAVIVIGCATTTVAFALLAVAHDQAWQILAVTTLYGIGAGLVFSSMAGVVVLAVPPHQSGVASGLNANIRTIGGSLGTAITASVISLHQGPGGYPREHGYVVGFMVLAAAMCAATIFALFVPGRPRAARALVPSANDADDSALREGFDITFEPGLTDPGQPLPGRAT
ncbi:MFS transporter [Micromonospora sp. NPDC005206]|uniref:MFS transporter n=1 Tax=Micromonospora sp. NPDC005206 TaxID=3157022 RepID=UPI0033A3FDAD